MIVELIYIDYSNNLRERSLSNERTLPIFSGFFVLFCFFKAKEYEHCQIVQAIMLQKAQTYKLCYHGANNLNYQPCDCQDFEWTMHPQLPDKNKNKHSISLWVTA